MSVYAGLVWSVDDGTGSWRAMSGSLARRLGLLAAMQLTLKRVALAPTATGMAVWFARSQV